jgi:hypothetical protein
MNDAVPKGAGALEGVLTMMPERIIAPRLRLVVLGSPASGWFIHAGLLAGDGVTVPVEGPYVSRDYAELRLAHLVPREITEAILMLAESGVRTGGASPLLRV